VSAGSPHPEAETALPRPAPDAGATNSPNPDPDANPSGQDGSGDLRASELADVLTAAIPPINEYRRAASETEAVTLQADTRHGCTMVRPLTFGEIAAVVDGAGYRRVVEDDDTIERLAQAMWFGPPAWSALIVQEEYAPIWRAKARAVVRALREETA
jgi:hypothetical protein